MVETVDVPRKLIELLDTGAAKAHTMLTDLLSRYDQAKEQAGAHRYLSTACFHGDHDYCKSMTGYHGEKRPARCKFCDARCACFCHGPLGEVGDE